MVQNFTCFHVQISGDNKAAAELITESWGRARVAAWEAPAATTTASPKEGQAVTSSAQGSGAAVDQQFVAAFAQGSVADTSPNTQGPFCTNTGVLLGQLALAGAVWHQALLLSFVWRVQVPHMLCIIKHMSTSMLLTKVALATPKQAE